MLKYLANVTSNIILIHKKAKKVLANIRTIRYGNDILLHAWLYGYSHRGENITKALKKWKNSYDNVNDELSSRVNEIEKYKSPTDDDTQEFIESEDTLKSAIEKTISKDMKGDLQTAKSKIRKDSDGRCTILCGGKLVAYSYSYDKAKKIENSLRDIIEDEKVKERIKNRSIDYQEMSRLEQLFKIKLACFVGIIRMWNSILPFKQTKEYDDENG